MTDKQIMQALNCCTSKSISCQKCPLLSKSKCERELIHHSFDLINRQQAEIEKARAEAIKEFAERLGNYKEYRYNENCDFVPYVRMSDIRKVEKEMIGADNDK